MDVPISYRVKRSAGRKVRILIRPNGEVEVRAPGWVPEEYIDGVVKGKAEWIRQSLEKVRHNQELRSKFVFDSARFLGKQYPVHKSKDQRTDFDGKRFRVQGQTADEMRQALSKWYRKAAREIFEERVAHYATRMGVTPAGVRVNGAKTRWGSCSEKGNINLCWKLVMAEGHLIDYIVIHELAHLKEMNHSEEFWALVAEWCPDYKACRQELKVFQAAIDVEGWDGL